MIRNASARLATSVVGALLGVMLLGSAGVSAANTRVVCFDTPSSSNSDCSSFSSSGAIQPGVLVFSAVTTGNRTAVQVQVRNDSGSTLNHVKFAGGDVADNLSYNPDFPNPYSTTSLPAGATVTAIFPAAGCTIESTSLGFICDIGTLAAKAKATFTVVITPPATAGVYPAWFTASWNEGWSSTGSNADYTFANGNIAVTDPTCATGTANYFLPGESVVLSDGGLTCQQERGAVGAGQLGGNGGFGSLGIDSPTTTPACPAGIISAKFSCYGTTVSVVINGGVPVTGGVQWTVTWFGIKSLSGVIHYLDNYDPSKPSTYVTIPLTKKYQCSSTLLTNCWNSVTASNGSANPLWITVVFTTPNNGRGGGFI